jgi:hypothetical protein
MQRDRYIEKEEAEIEAEYERGEISYDTMVRERKRLYEEGYA